MADKKELTPRELKKQADALLVKRLPSLLKRPLARRPRRIPLRSRPTS